MRIMPRQSGRGGREEAPTGVEGRRGSLGGVHGVGPPERLDHSWDAVILASAHTAALADNYLPEGAFRAGNGPPALEHTHTVSSRGVTSGDPSMHHNLSPHPGMNAALEFHSLTAIDVRQDRGAMICRGWHGT